MKPVCALYHGTVVHRRVKPMRHDLRYRVFNLLVDLDELPDLGRRLRLFSHNRPNLFGFHDRDHGARDGGPLRPWVEAGLARAGIDLAGGPIRLLCYPRLLGYVFNPLSIYFCHRADGRLAAVLYEVSNTFGESHTYLFPTPKADPDGGYRHACDKEFYVSPFIGMAMRYHFHLVPPAATVAIGIRETDAEGALLHARFTGRHAPLSDRALLGAFMRYPLMTFKVMAGIHWEALKLWRKRARFHPRPAPPDQPIRIVAPASFSAVSTNETRHAGS